MNDVGRLARQLEMSLKYDMLTTLDGDGERVVDRIMCLSDIEFEQLKSVFKSRIEFFDAIGEAGRQALEVCLGC